MFFDSYIAICKKFGESPSTLATKLGIGKGAYSQWKRGAEPTNPTKKKIADYFNISVSELESGQIETPSVTDIDDGRKPESDEIANRIMRLPPDKRELVRIFLQGLEAGLKD